jgi:hypothetical protein
MYTLRAREGAQRSQIVLLPRAKRRQIVTKVTVWQYVKTAGLDDAMRFVDARPH